MRRPPILALFLLTLAASTAAGGAASATALPAAARKKLETARFKLEAGDLGGAESAASLGLRLAPDSLDLLLLRAEVRRRMGDLGPALQDLDLAIARHPDSGRAHLARARVREAAGKDRDALADFTAVTKESVSLSPQAYQGRGRIKRKLGMGKGAERDLTKAITLDPGLGAAWLARGELRLDARRFQGAREDLRHALEAGEDSERAHTALAYAELGVGDLDAAKVEALRLAAYHAASPGPHLLHARLEELRLRPENALSDCAIAISKAPELPDAYAERGAILYALGRYQKAEKNLGVAIYLDQDPRPAEELLLLLCRLRKDPTATEEGLGSLRKRLKEGGRPAWALSVCDAFLGLNDTRELDDFDSSREFFYVSQLDQVLLFTSDPVLRRMAAWLGCKAPDSVEYRIALLQRSRPRSRDHASGAN